MAKSCVVRVVIGDGPPNTNKKNGDNNTVITISYKVLAYRGGIISLWDSNKVSYYCSSNPFSHKRLNFQYKNKVSY